MSKQSGYPVGDKPQIYTSELLAVRGLAALVEAYPRETSTALGRCGIVITGAVEPKSVLPELSRQDLPFRTDAGEEILFEVKVDSHVDVDQITMIESRHPNAKIVLLVADKLAPDVIQSLPKLPRSVAVVGWDELLDGFAESRHVRRLRADVHAIVDDPTSKRKQRYALIAAVSAAPPPDRSWKPTLEPTAGRLPAILLDSPCGNVRAQMQVSVRADRTFWYTPGVGFTSGNTNGELTSLLERVIGPLEAAEAADQFVISRSKQGAGEARAVAVGMSDRPWFSRGYVLDYIGVKLRPRSSPAVALMELYGAFAVFEEIALQNGSRL